MGNPATAKAKGQSVKFIYWGRGKVPSLLGWRGGVVPHGGLGRGKESSLICWRGGVVPQRAEELRRTRGWGEAQCEV